MLIHSTAIMEDFHHFRQFLVDMHSVGDGSDALGYNYSISVADSENFASKPHFHSTPHRLHEAAQIQDILRYFMRGASIASNLALVPTDVMTNHHVFCCLAAYFCFLLDDDGDETFFEILLCGVAGAVALSLLVNNLDEDRFCLLSVTELISTKLFSIPRSVHH